jgi:hypothetical protein
MKGDFSRTTFDQRHRFSRVLMQQGRVLLDADWNEQTSIVLDFLRTLATDLIGPHGGPGDGFRIVADPERPRDFVIERGHYWVDGILCVNEAPARRDGSDDAPLTWGAQPGWPLLDDETELEAGAAYFAYLDVWERAVTWLEADHIREVALGGPDTAARARIVWQVRVLELTTSPPDERTCAAILDSIPPRPGPQLAARARVESPSDDPCVIPPEARYRGAENQLYRVEIHGAGDADESAGATFKWSRHNGSVAFGIRSLEGSTVELDWLGPDERRSLQAGDWVEIVDDHSVLRFEPRPLLRVESIDRVRHSVVLDVPDGMEIPVFDEDTATHPLLLRWDQGSDALPVREGRWIDLEDGVQVRFEPGGSYAVGDYWLVPARTATGDVLWPTEPDDDGVARPQNRPPDGIEHHYAPLARLTMDGQGGITNLEDCRCTFDTLYAAQAARAEDDEDRRPPFPPRSHT